MWTICRVVCTTQTYYDLRNSLYTTLLYYIKSKYVIIFVHLILMYCIYPVSYTHLDVYKRQSIDRLIRLAYPEAPEDFRIRFAVQTFIDGIGDCELQQVLRMARHRDSSEALVHALEFEAAKSASRYINGFVPSGCSQKTVSYTHLLGR